MTSHNPLGKQFFIDHQKLLVWFANTKAGKRFFRISGDAPRGKKIVKILPNCYTWSEGGNRFTTDFRTHEKFGKILHYRLRYFWMTLHILDYPLDYLKMPSFGFASYTYEDYPDEHPETKTVDGYVSELQGSGVSWATLKGGAGTHATDDATNNPGTCIAIASTGSVGNPWSLIRRAIFLFDTSTIGQSADILTAVMSLYGQGKADTFTTPIAPSVVLSNSNPASNTALVAGDWDSITDTKGTAVEYADWDTAGYNAMTYSSSQIGEIAKTGITKAGVWEGHYDAPDIEPGWEQNKSASFNCYYADETGTTKDPKLVVTYDIIGEEMFHGINQ